VRRPHDRNRRYSACEHFRLCGSRLCGSLEHLMIPTRDPITAQCPGSAPASCRHPAIAFSDRRQIVSSQLTPRAAAASGAIDQSMSHGATNLPIAAQGSLDSNRRRHSASTTGSAQLRLRPGAFAPPSDQPRSATASVKRTTRLIKTSWDGLFLSASYLLKHVKQLRG
jgi:hypothetical protein